MDLLLHICCGPCSLFVIDDLRKAYPSCRLEGLFVNPNIHPREEFLRRQESTRQACSYKKLPLDLLPDYDQECWETFSGETAARCRMCYAKRLEKTARYAAEKGFTHFTTSLLVSPYQDQEALRQWGEAAASRYGVSFLYRDFRPGFRSGQQQARDLGLYRQKYCGCIKSLEERTVERKQERIRPKPGSNDPAEAAGGRDENDV